MAVLEKVLKYQKFLQKCLEKQIEDKHLVSILVKLDQLPVTLDHLQETGIGKTVNGFRKFKEPIGDGARSLVTKWKLMVQEAAEAAEAQDDDSSVEKATQSGTVHTSIENGTSALRLCEERSASKRKMTDNQDEHFTKRKHLDDYMKDLSSHSVGQSSAKHSNDIGRDRTKHDIVNRHGTSNKHDTKDKQRTSDKHGTSDKCSSSSSEKVKDHSLPRYASSRLSPESCAESHYSHNAEKNTQRSEHNGIPTVDLVNKLKKSDVSIYKKDEFEKSLVKESNEKNKKYSGISKALENMERNCEKSSTSRQRDTSSSSRSTEKHSIKSTSEKRESSLSKGDAKQSGSDVDKSLERKDMYSGSGKHTSSVCVSSEKPHSRSSEHRTSSANHDKPSTDGLTSSEQKHTSRSSKQATKRTSDDTSKFVRLSQIEDHSTSVKETDKRNSSKVSTMVDKHSSNSHDNHRHKHHTSSSHGSEKHGSDSPTVATNKKDKQRSPDATSVNSSASSYLPLKEPDFDDDFLKEISESLNEELSDRSKKKKVPTATLR